MAGSPQVGLDAKGYYNSGTHASPTWVEITDIIDCNPASEAGAVTIKSRASKWQGDLPGLLKAGCTLTILHRKGTDSVRAALLAAHTGRTLVEFAFMDQAIATTGAIGLRTFCMVANLGRAENLEEGLQYDVTLNGGYAIESSSKVDPDYFVAS